MTDVCAPAATRLERIFFSRALHSPSVRVARRRAVRRWPQRYALFRMSSPRLDPSPHRPILASVYFSCPGRVRTRRGAAATVGSANAVPWRRQPARGVATALVRRRHHDRLALLPSVPPLVSVSDPDSCERCAVIARRRAVLEVARSRTAGRGPRSAPDAAGLQVRMTSCQPGRYPPDGPAGVLIDTGLPSLSGRSGAGCRRGLGLPLTCRFWSRHGARASRDWRRAP